MKPPFVICHADSKRPVGFDWSNNSIDAAELAKRLANNPAANVGILLGPESGFVDVECDSPEAETTFLELFGDIRSPCWASKRGRHHLFRYDARLGDLPGTVKLPSQLEFRLGNGKAVQSVIPPSMVDGVKREWITSMDECEPAPLPEHVIELLLSLPREKEGEHRETSEAQASPELIRRAINYVQKLETGLKDGRKGVAFRAAGQLYAFVDEVTGGRLSEQEIVNLLTPWNMQLCPPLPIDVLREKVRNAMTYTPRPDKVIEPDVDLDAMIDEASLAQANPRIDINHELHRMVEEAASSLGNAPNTHTYGQALMEIVYDAEKPPQCLHDNGSPQLKLIPLATLATRLSACADWYKLETRAKKRKWTRATPPPAVISAVHALNDWPSVPPITGIVSCPVLRPDGTILAEPGYDRQTGIYLENGESYPGLMQPDNATALLCDVVCDFPFQSQEHRSAWLAFVITMVARPAFAGNAPFFLFDATAPGTGKGLLTDIATMIVEGRVACRYSWSNNNEETRKLITTVGLAGLLYMMFDNIKGTLGGAALEQMMTTGIWADRILGGNRQVTFPIRFIPAGTSNNAKLSTDMIRRTCLCKQHSKLEDPAERSDFKHPDLLEYVKQNRAELVMAALSIPAAYIKAGRPDQNLTEWGSYQQWSDLVRNSIVWAGLPDPGETRKDLKAQSDDDTAILRGLMNAWPGSVSIAKALEIAIDNKPLQDILAELPGREPKQALATLLRAARSRNVGGRSFERTEGRPSKWFVSEALKA